VSLRLLKIVKSKDQRNLIVALCGNLIHLSQKKIETASLRHSGTTISKPMPLKGISQPVNTISTVKNAENVIPTKTED